MIAAWMVYALIVGCLLALAARGLEGAARLASRPLRSVWAGALALTIVLTALAPRLAARRNVPVLHPAADAIAPLGVSGATLPADEPAAVHVSVMSAMRRAVAIRTRQLLATAEQRVPAAVEIWLLIIWFAASALLLTLFVAVHWRFRRARRRWPAAELHGLRVRLAPHTGPALLGLAHPDIVVPHWLLQRNAEDQRLAFAHEHQHLRARDPLLLAGGWLAAVLLPWHPAVWWMIARLRLAVELDCDARVLREGADAGCYGTLLIELAGRCSGLRIAALALADSSSHLERRLIAMTAHRPRFVAARATALAAIALGAVLVACEAELPTATDVVRPQAGVVVAKEGGGEADSSSGHAFSIFPLGSFSMDSIQVRLPSGPAITPELYDLVRESLNELNQRRAIGAAVEKALSTRDWRTGTTNAVAVDCVQSAPHRAAVACSLTIGPDRTPGEIAPANTGAVVPGWGFLATSVNPKQVHVSRAPAGPLTRFVDVTPVGSGGFRGLVLIDGVPADEVAIRALPLAATASAKVLLGSIATKRYSDPRAKRGVLLITTKRGATKR